MRRPRVRLVLLSIWAFLGLAVCALWIDSYWSARSFQYLMSGLTRSGPSVESACGTLRLCWTSQPAGRRPSGLRYTHGPYPGGFPGAPAWPWRIFGRGLPTLRVSGNGPPGGPAWGIDVTLPWFGAALLTASPAAVILARRLARRRKALPVVPGRFVRYATRASAALFGVALALLILSYIQQFAGRWEWQQAEGPTRDRVRQRYVHVIMRRGAIGICSDAPDFSASATKTGVIQDNWRFMWRWERLDDQWYWKGEEGSVFNALGFGFQHRGPTAIAGVIPFWPLIIAFAILPIWQFRRRRLLLLRVRHGHCLHCGYDLRAGHDLCPECGNRPTERQGGARGESASHSEGTRFE